MKPLNLQTPIDKSQIPKDLPGNSHRVIMQEINLRNELLYLQNQSGMPDETVFVAAFSHSFYASYEGGECIFNNGNSNGYEQCLVCSDNNGCTMIYAGKIGPNNEIDNELTYMTEILVDIIFTESHKFKVIETLSIECGNNLPLCESLTPKQLERIRFAALKTSRGSFDELQNSVNLAKIDWRDLLLQAGFADDITSHDKWATEMIAAIGE